MRRLTRYALAFLAVEIVVSTTVIALHREQSQHTLNVNLAEQRAAYDAILTGTRRLTDLAFDSRVTTAENLRLFHQANSPDDEQAAVARGLLYRKLYPLAQDMKRNHVRQMHVHLPGGISFLRMHRPERYGDPLYPYRPILKKVNETRAPATGFETGRVTHGFRFAYPIIDDGDLLATFEFSMSFTAIREELERTAALPETHYQFIVKRRAVEPKLFEGRETLYRNSPVNPAYVVEDPASSLRNEAGGNELPRDVAELDHEIARSETIQRRMEGGEAFGRFIKAGGMSYAVNFLPVESATGGQAGYILAYTPAADHDELTNASFAIWLLGSLLLLLTFTTHHRLQKSRHFMSTVAEHMGSGLYVTDNRGRITYVNAAATDTLGYSRHELLGRNAHDTFHAHPPEPTPEGDECPFERVVRGGTLFSSDNETFRDAHDRLREVEVLSTPLDLDTGEKGAVTVFRDVTDRRRSEEKLQQVVTALRNSREGVMITDRNLSILDVNEAFTTVTGYQRQEILGRTPRVLQSGRQGPEFYEQMWHELDTADNWRGEIWNRRKDGSIYPEWLTISAIRNDDNEVTHYVAIFSDITDLHEANQRLEAQAHQDALTGLANRHALERHLDSLIRQPGARFAVLFVDLDHFKRVNDTMGHAMGDRLLREMAGRMQGMLRSHDMLARLGGDEFVAVLEDLDGPDDAAAVARKLIEEISRPYELGDNELSVGASIGVALYPENGDSAATLLRNADTAMYQAKAEGRNNHHFYTAELTRLVTERMKIESQLRRAVENEEFSIHYQPQIDLASGRIVGAEALLRWESPDGPVSPAIFIPVAEQTGQINAIGRWVLDTACQQLRCWRDRGIEGSGDLRMAVNLSAQQLSSPDIIADVDNAIDHAGIPAGQLELEITETAVMQDPFNACKLLEAFRERGVKLAIDDFGTGYSSLSYLKQLPIDYLKIDQSFVRGIPEDLDDLAIVDAIIALGNSLELVTIAEGVETRAQLDELRHRGCGVYQGYFFSRPLPASAFERLLRED
ncbi:MULTISPECIES: EAL domain-containing protein [unclassified Guyparkeria]|uniref:bifunctional diguanylate cyclase/phosphodiesterase n=1 Tax=unclassified Guyparkeria TaxID=2626246 RepID=UPI0007334625|nr:MULTISPECIES: EAL domain-containing protein [unclassified Guyparkeria]KTG16837.1 hypothetical protein AUR63_01880 [Guyparkeria sp. XI15]OAE85871.1 hypothetical protein AWR35_01880 [Guyparkeria sp. WRN-7]